MMTPPMSQAKKRSSSDDVAAFRADRLPLPFDELGILFGPRLHAEKDASGLERRFVALDAILRKAPVMKRANQAARDGGGTGPRQRCGHGPGDENARSEQKRANSRGCSEQRRQRATGGGPHGAGPPRACPRRSHPWLD